MRKRRYPQEVFSLSFLDVITSTGGLFLLLVLIFFTAIFIGTDYSLKKEIKLLYGEINELTTIKIPRGKSILDLWNTKNDSLLF